MKVGIIEPVGGHGGMDYYDYGLASGLGQSDIKVLLLSSTQTEVRDFLNVSTIKTFKKVWDTKNKIKRLYYFLSGYRRSFSLLRKEKISFAHFHFFDLGKLNCLVLLIASFYKFKKVLTLHDVSSFDKKNKFRSANHRLENWLLNRFDKIIVHNELSKRELIKKGCSEHSISIIPHGNYLPFVDKLNFDPSKDKKLNLLFFGQIKEVKGLDILLEGLSILKNTSTNFKLTIAGKPWHDDKLKYINTIKIFGLENHIETKFEFIPDNQVANYFSKSDIVILPYKKIYQSGVLLLSMSYGRPVLVSDIPAFKEIVTDNKTGFLFENENPQSLANKLASLIIDKQQLISINNNAFEMLVSEFNWNNIGEKTKQVYLNL
tara:strand:- start:61 stop:1185 length:1125 start_codon:yes stop_codon:yes gene_type:complete